MAGGGSYNNVADRQTSLQVQSSAYGIAVPVVFGTNRVGGNLVWFGNFQTHSHTEQTGGKGGGSSTSTTFTYTGAAIMALCEGQIAGVGRVWKDRDQTTLADLGLTLFTGGRDQAEWSWLTGWATSGNFSTDNQIGYDSAATYVDQAINYSSMAYVCASSYDLGTAAAVMNHSFEIQGFNIIGGGNQDAFASDIIPAILTNEQYGLGLSSGKMGDFTQFATYCQAAGLFFSPAYIDQRAGTDCIQELCDAANSGVFWSGGKLKITPYGDTTITGNGATFTPNLTPAYDLDDDSFMPTDGSPVRVTRSTPADAYNRVQVQFRNRDNQYSDEIVYDEDLDAIEKYGLKVAPVIQLDFVCTAAIAKQIAQLALQRLLYKRNTYEFTLKANYAMLEPMDIVTLTDSGLGMLRTPVRITEIEEQDSSFLVHAEDMPIGVASAATYPHDDGIRWQNRRDIPPLSCAAPIVFEMPADPTVTGLAVAIAVGGQPTDLMYGGCRVWLSLDGLEYKEEAVVYGSSRYGTTTASLAANAAGIDSTHTLKVLLRSNGQLIGGSSDDLERGTTRVIVDGEYLAYQYANLTATRAYDLTTLNRGLYGTTPGAHASGSLWVRVDDNIAQLKDLNLDMIGQTVYIKMTAFNVYGEAEEDLADVSAYSYTITGGMKILERVTDQNNMLSDGTDLSIASVANGATIEHDPSSTGRPISKDWFELKTSSNSTGTWSEKKIPVMPGEALYYGYSLSASATSANVIRGGYEKFGADGSSLGTVDLTDSDLAVSDFYGSVGRIETIFEIPSGVAFITPYIKRLTSTTGIVKAGEPYLGRHQQGADVTANAQILVSMSPTTITIEADYTGAILAGQLPRILTPTVTKGGVDVRTRSTSSYALAGATGTMTDVSVNNTTGSADKGRVTIAAISDSGSFNLYTTVNGVDQPAIPVTVIKHLAAPPISSTAGGTFTPAGLTSTSYIELGRVENVGVTTGQTLTGNLSGNYSDGINSPNRVRAKWQYSPAGANTWTDMGSAVTGGDCYSGYIPPEWGGGYYDSPGSITVNHSVTPTTGNYDVRLVALSDYIYTYSYSGTTYYYGPYWNGTPTCSVSRA